MEPLDIINFKSKNLVEFNSNDNILQKEIDERNQALAEKASHLTVLGDNIEFKAKRWTSDSTSITDNNVANVDSIFDGRPFVRFPSYKISDYTNTIYNWRKQVNPFGTKGFFYFKVFFNFNTNYGLLGGVKKVGSQKLADINTAFGYLNNLQSVYGSKSPINILDRLKALESFVNGLAHVSDFTPWFFKEINGLNNIRSTYINDEDFSDKKAITIKCSEESVDMRLGTLFDLYKFCCYDNIHNKEIIPANLRKFEMSVVLFHVPLKKYHTEFSPVGTDLRFKEKSIDFNNKENIMSFKMYTFMNCEFDAQSLNELSDSLSNEVPFDLGKNSIQINYDRVFEHRMNEWEHIGFGSDRIFIDENDNINIERLQAIENDIQRILNLPRYRYYADESKLQNRTGIETENGINPDSRFNTLYMEEKLTKLKTHKFQQDNLYGNFTNVRSKYYLDKLNYMKDGTIEKGNLYGYDFGRTGEGVYRHNTMYLDRKLDNIKYGTVNRTGPDTDLDERMATPNMFTLSWNAEAIRNSNNMYAVDGIQSTKHTWAGRLAEATWQRAKNAFGF